MIHLSSEVNIRIDIYQCSCQVLLSIQNLRVSCRTSSWLSNTHLSPRQLKWTPFLKDLMEPPAKGKERYEVYFLLLLIGPTPDLDAR